MLRYLLSLVFVICDISSADAKPPEIRPGKYVRDRDTGSLTIRKDDTDRLTFEIESIARPVRLVIDKYHRSALANGNIYNSTVQIPQRYIKRRKWTASRPEVNMIWW